MEITKIKLNKELTEVFYVVAEGTATEERHRKDAKTPAPEFAASFASLKTMANEITEGWVNTTPVKSFRVNLIGFKKDQGGHEGCFLNITAEFKHSNRPISFNTMVKYSVPDGVEDETKLENYLSGKAVDLMNDLKTHAQDWMNGVRAQAVLDLVPNIPDAPTLHAGNKTYDDAGAEKVAAPKRLRKGRKTCYDCAKPSTMVVEGIGYCQEHGTAKLVVE